jgi:hypothetical protein
MKLFTPGRTRWVLVVVFAVGMAWVESASVYYLRMSVDRLNPYQIDPLPMRGALERVELVREAATLVMLLAIGSVAGWTWLTRLGYTAIAFGVWDIFYYVFLKLICDWPKSLSDWDVLFLLPLPWWGPVLAPACVAALMIVWGTLVTQPAVKDPAGLVTPNSWLLSLLGIVLALCVFMADSLRSVPQGLDAAKNVLPQAFNWPAFVVALALMATPVAQMAWRMRPRNASAII